MTEIKAQVQQATDAFEKVIAEQNARFETTAAELLKLQTKSIAQTQSFIEDVTRLAREQIAFTEQIGNEWKKVVLASVKSTSEVFVPKA